MEEAYPYTRKTMVGFFSYKGVEYKLKITDPEFESKFIDRPLGDYDIERTLLTISLGENFKESYYKLIAGIIPIAYGKKWSAIGGMNCFKANLSGLRSLRSKFIVILPVQAHWLNLE